MHYVIQENLFQEIHFRNLISSLERLGLNYTIVRIFPFSDKIVRSVDIPEMGYDLDLLPDFDPSDKNVFVFGAIKLSRIASDKGWNPGSMINSNHDFSVYREFYGDNLLNFDSIITTLREKIDWEKPFDLKFIRPTKDNKAFAGNLFTLWEWEDMIENYLHNYKGTELNEDTQIQVSTPKNIMKEVRFWIVRGKIITWSQYKLDNNLVLHENVDEESIFFVKRMIDLYQLADAFVMDVCLTETGWKIVECGCINCAGFYKSDVQKIINAVEQNF
jgi:hypothetical protein